MHRHIKMLARPSTESGYMDAVIVEQTHTNDGFSDEIRSHIFTASNGVMLHSSAFPQYQSYQGRGKFQIACRGWARDRDLLTLLVPTHDWPLVVEAIEEYNITYAE